MRWYFQPRAERDQAGDDDQSAGGISDLPPALLQRHGARILNPADAAQAGPTPAPRSTVYRAKTLLVPGNLLDTSSSLQAINAVLARIGMQLAPMAADHPKDDARAAARASRELAARIARLPRTAVLIPAGNGHAGHPVVVDAWVALQALRAAATARRRTRLSTEILAIELDHLMAGSAIGSPASVGDGISGSPATDGHGITGPGSTDSYLYAGGDARTPVAVCLEAPPRESLADCGRRFGRRPVIMTLDTGALPHPWLNVKVDRKQPGGYRALLPDGFVAIDQAMQDAIRLDSEQAFLAGDQPRHVIRGPWDRPFSSEPLLRELATDVGHGTFIVGIVRQIAPDAKVLSVRIMHSDGIVYQSDLMSALRLLAARVAAATAKGGDMGRMVDVLSLSLGYFSETQADADYTSGLWDAIDLLLGMGVAVTASAGNYATSRRCYPAAFADRAPTKDPSAPLISVGALNPNGSKALFSDGGGWIRAWATGAAIVSTYPVVLNGSREPQVSRPAHPANPIPPGQPVHAEREALDPDDFSDGWAVWSGTSFSAPLVAAHLARALLTGAARRKRLRLDQGGTDAAVRRIVHALDDLEWPG